MTTENTPRRRSMRHTVSSVSSHNNNEEILRENGFFGCEDGLNDDEMSHGIKKCHINHHPEDIADEPLSEVELAIKIFIIPSGWKQCESLRAIDQFGVSIQKDEETKYICLADAVCRSQLTQRAASSTSPIWRHLNQHGHESTQTTESQLRKTLVNEEYLQSTSTTLFKFNFNRFAQLLWTIMIVLEQLPFNLVEKASCRKIFALVCCDGMDASFGVSRLKHLIIEIFASVKFRIISDLDRRPWRHVGIMNLVIDLWKSKQGGLSSLHKFIAINGIN